MWSTILAVAAFGCAQHAQPLALPAYVALDTIVLATGGNRTGYRLSLSRNGRWEFTGNSRLLGLEGTYWSQGESSDFSQMVHRAEGDGLIALTGIYASPGYDLPSLSLEFWEDSTVAKLSMIGMPKEMPRASLKFIEAFLGLAQAQQWIPR